MNKHFGYPNRLNFIAEFNINFNSSLNLNFLVYQNWEFYSLQIVKFIDIWHCTQLLVVTENI